MRFARHSMTWSAPLKGLPYVPSIIMTAKLKSDGAAKREMLRGVAHRQHRYRNYGCEGGVSNVDIDGNNTCNIKYLGVVIATFDPRLSDRHLLCIGAHGSILPALRTPGPSERSRLPWLPRPCLAAHPPWRTPGFAAKIACPQAMRPAAAAAYVSIDTVCPPIVPCLYGTCRTTVAPLVAVENASPRWRWDAPCDSHSTRGACACEAMHCERHVLAPGSGLRWDGT